MASFRIQWLVCTWLLLENDTAHVLSHSLLQCWKPTKKFLFLPRGNFSVGFFKKRSWAFTSSHLVYTCTSYICTSYACTSCIFTSYVNTSHIFTSYSTSSHLASSHPMPAHPMPARLKASRLTASPLTSSHLTSAHLTSSRLTSSALTSSHLTSSLSLFLSVSFPLSLSFCLFSVLSSLSSDFYSRLRRAVAARDYEKVVFCILLRPLPAKRGQSSQSSKTEEKLRKRFGRKTKEKLCLVWWLRGSFVVHSITGKYFLQAS